MFVVPLSGRQNSVVFLWHNVYVREDSSMDKVLQQYITYLYAHTYIYINYLHALQEIVQSCAMCVSVMWRSN